MLYDKRWEKKAETKADPFTLEALIAWLEQQPADRKYNWMDCDGFCLIDQYGASIGEPRLGANLRKLTAIFGDDFANYSAVCNGLGAWTFGAALERARDLQNSRETPAY